MLVSECLEERVNFTVFVPPVPFTEAIEQCRAVGGELARVDTLEEFLLVRDLASLIDVDVKGQGYWIGESPPRHQALLA